METDFERVRNPFQEWKCISNAFEMLCNSGNGFRARSKPVAGMEMDFVRVRNAPQLWKRVSNALEIHFKNGIPFQTAFRNFSTVRETATYVEFEAVHMLELHQLREN
jgi:hypothetical protein